MKSLDIAEAAELAALAFERAGWEWTYESDLNDPYVPGPAMLALSLAKMVQDVTVGQEPWHEIRSGRFRVVKETDEECGYQTTTVMLELASIDVELDVTPAIYHDDQDETPNQGRGDDLDRTEGEDAPGTAADAGIGGTGDCIDGPVGHDHGGAAGEPEPASEGDRASAPPGTTPPVPFSTICGIVDTSQIPDGAIDDSPHRRRAPGSHDPSPPQVGDLAGMVGWGYRETAVREYDDPEQADPVVYRRVGKKMAGRLLDGQAWDMYPEVQPVRLYPTAGYGTGEVLRLVPGISERQLHYWRMSGAITPAHGGSSMGSGNRVVWSERDVVRLRAISHFLEAVETIVGQVHTDAIRRIWSALEHEDSVELGANGISIVVRIGAAE